ncbi:MAG TPA: agmatinase [Methanothermobacter sp.]|nr:agmatinase [Methanothermobacter sp.]
MYLYTENPLKFAFSETDFDASHQIHESGFCILGVPFDSTATYQPGSRYGPLFVREASYNFENYNLFFDTRFNAQVYDIGNLEIVPGNVQKTCANLKSVVSSLLDDDLTPITIGGEHTISLGVINALKIQDITILHFDAHMDLRDNYIGEKYSHATVMRRIHDKKPFKIIQMGIRSSSLDEADFARDNNIDFYTANEIKFNMKKMERIIHKITGPIYVTIDMDVLDPAYAPSVSTPAPCGITPQELENLISCLKGKEIIGFDVVEVSSTSIGDITSINAAKIILDLLFLK